MSPKPTSRPSVLGHLRRAAGSVVDLFNPPADAGYVEPPALLWLTLVLLAAVLLYALLGGPWV